MPPKKYREWTGSFSKPKATVVLKTDVRIFLVKIVQQLYNLLNFEKEN